MRSVREAMGRAPRRAMLLIGAAAGLSGLPAGCAKAPPSNVIVAAGHVEGTDVHVAAKVGGRLLRFTLQEGDVVQADQVLAEIDTTDNRLAARQAHADRDQAAAELDLRLAGSRPEDIAEAASQVANAKADLEGAQKDLDRMQALLDRGSGTAKSRDDARTRRDMTMARLRGTQDALARTRHGSRPQEIAQARAHLASLDAHAATLEQQIKDATVRSPLTGVVTEKVAQQGELLQPGSPLCVITDLANAWLTVYVAETDLGRIRLGQPAEVATDAGQRRSGHITYISSEAEFTPKNVQTRDERVKLVFKVKVGLDNRDGLFKPGMPATARFQATANAGAPDQATANAGAPDQATAPAGAPDQSTANAGAPDQSTAPAGAPDQATANAGAPNRSPAGAGS
ncbi:MAG: efflux RND transporter periplasmic adaptor subunit [Acidobacteria bacterium]|nr:efflux RND transporter periplasmic adaptor subunit [Acidobacteriota bacterium]